MTDDAGDTALGPVYLGARTAIVGVSLALVVSLLALGGFDALQPGYWLGIGIAFVGIAVVAGFGSQRSTSKYGVGLFSISLGIVVTGAGIYPGPLSLTVVGAVVAVAGAVLVGFDTRNVAQKDR